MLDTINKDDGSLTEVMAHFDIAQFVQQAKDQQMLCGLAGSLSLDDIPELMSYQTDYLGFRGALCLKHDRTAQLSKSSIIQIKRTIELCGQEQLQAKNRILIADDSEINRVLLKNILEVNGYTVDAAANGEEALQLLTDNLYKLALIDINMPVLSGLELVKILRQQNKSYKLAAISTYVDDSQKLNALAAGFDYCLAKPIDEDELITLIRKASGLL
jgi:CheY-like chemotaxis protein